MQAIDFIKIISLSMGLFVILSVLIYAALPKVLLECAQLHGRYHGLSSDEGAAAGTPQDADPMGAVVLESQPA